MGAGGMYVILNVVRALAVATLLLAATVSVLLMVLRMKHFATHFFSIVSDVTRCFTSLCLVATEVPISVTKRYLDTHFPVYTVNHSLAWTGIPMVALAASLLSELHSSLVTATVHSVLEAAGISVGLMGILYCMLPLVLWRTGDCRTIRRDGASGTSEGGKETWGSEGSASPLPPMHISRPILTTQVGGASKFVV